MYNECPRCHSNNWSKLQTGNEENKRFYFNKFCNDCHKFSFSYKCTPSGDDEEIEGICIETKEYIVNISYCYNKTIISENLTGIEICNIYKAINLVNVTDEYIDNKIKTIILFS